MLPAFEPSLIEAIVRLDNDSDFQLFADYIKESVRSMAIKSVEMVGPEAEKVKGGCVAIMELRDMIAAAKEVVRANRERAEMADLDRDTISP